MDPGRAGGKTSRAANYTSIWHSEEWSEQHCHSTQQEERRRRDEASGELWVCSHQMPLLIPFHSTYCLPNVTKELPEQAKVHGKLDGEDTSPWYPRVLHDGLVLSKFLASESSALPSLPVMHLCQNHFYFSGPLQTLQQILRSWYLHALPWFNILAL